MIADNNNNSNYYSRVIHPTQDSFNNNIFNTANIINDNKLINYFKRINRNTHRQKNKIQKTNGLL